MQVEVGSLFVTESEHHNMWDRVFKVLKIVHHIISEQLN